MYRPVRLAGFVFRRAWFGVRRTVWEGWRLADARRAVGLWRQRWAWRRAARGCALKRRNTPMAEVIGRLKPE